MNPNRTYEENMAALKKVLTQRTYTALSHRNIEFVLKYQNATTHAGHRDRMGAQPLL